MSARPEHTPGPWKVIETPGRWVVSTENGAPTQAVIAIMDDRSVMVGRSVQGANARLIAAAPDLLAACEAVASDWPGIVPSRASDMVSAAIARARGGQ